MYCRIDQMDKYTLVENKVRVLTVGEKIKEQEEEEFCESGNRYQYELVFFFLIT